MAIEKIASAAERLGNNPDIMNSYRDFYNLKEYILTKNKDLGGYLKPSKFPAATYFIEEWKKYSQAQMKYLLYLADLNDKEINLKNYSKFKNAYEKWPNGYYVIYYGKNAKWACNLFVGEALHMAGYELRNGNKYYSAKDIWEAKGILKIVDKKDVERGDIAAFGGSHVEIVTKVNRGQTFFDDDFCSRGAGRGSSDFGTEKCEGFAGNSREIDNENIRFLTIRK
ncbi:hypothetical protein [Flavobacterium sp. AJR]|jgi:hypothetical protein|uniref:hypothetical protein n=1 Tax=Flavobacterium sp. AJR TaxID=1979369 RepID=UPI000A3D794A|nr:hypothetical protein [Flavobacterium sp. AJR]OUL60265.1 hypothetical protein B8T70_21255 [Flavobacterium sp. AJR]